MSITDLPAAGTEPPQPEKSPPDAAQQSPPGAVEQSRPSRSGTARAVQALAMRLHFYAGVFVAPFILIAAVTGALYAVAPSIESIVNRDLLHVDSTGPARPLSEQIAAGVAAEPGLALSAVDPAQHAGDTTRVIFTDPSLGESERRAVFVDPATATSVGDSVVYGSTGALPMRTWIDVLHRNLHLGDVGRLYSEMAASWMWIIALAGVVMWLHRSRGSLRRLLWPDRSKAGRPGSVSVHATVGMWILLPLLFLSATGLTWSLHAGQHITSLRQHSSWTTPVVDTALPGAPMPSIPAGGEHAEHTGGHGMSMPVPADRAAQADKVLAVARGHGIDGPVEISIPAKDTTAFTVKERRLPGVYTQDAIAVDGRTGDVTDILRYADWPLMAKLANWGIALHMGMLFGLANQLLLLATMIALITVIGRGYLMWWRRRPTRENDPFTFGRAPARGVLRRAPLWISVPLIAVTAGIGWFAPVLGVSLLAFLIVDVVLGLIAGRRRGAVA
ncbi:PepSY-associated TM helix domain-containing protein [Nocardia nova]|uniref:PepSY-associated TM helix domain-containing protein n=1 Tax=Nocardia nova TaxID=37330 RepID=UPI0026B126C7|nr:PepSY domain-containing protein [Nocardia nova]